MKGKGKGGEEEGGEGKGERKGKEERCAELRGRHAKIFGWAKSPLPPPLPSPLPFLPLPLPLLPFTSVPLEVGPLNTARESGERYKLPQLGLKLSPSGKKIWCILALKFDIL